MSPADFTRPGSLYGAVDLGARKQAFEAQARRETTAQETGDEEHGQAESDDAPESRGEGIEPPGGPARHPAGQEEISQRIQARDVEQ